MASRTAQIYRSLHQAQELVHLCHNAAHRAESADNSTHQQEQKIEQHEHVNDEYNTLSAASAIFLWQVLFALIFAYLLDCYLLGAGAEYLASTSGNKFLVNSARWIVPALILWLEILVGGLIHQSHVSFDDPEGTNLASFGYIVLGCILSVVVPTFSVAAVLASSGNKFPILIAALASLSFVTHALIIFSGTTMHNAKGYASYRLRRGYMGSRLSYSQNRLRQANRSLVNTYSELQQRIDFHNRIYPDNPIRNLLFDNITRRRVNSLFRGEEGDSAPATQNNNRPVNSPTASRSIRNDESQNSNNNRDPQQEVESFLDDNVDNDLTA